MLGKLVSSVAHELNNPLAGILGLGDLVVEDLRETGSAEVEDVESMIEQARRAIRIVRDLLDLAGRKGEGPETCDLNEVVRSSLGLLRYRFCARQIVPELELAPTLPLLPAESRAIGRLVLQLLMNARQALASRPGGRVVVRSALDSDGSVRLEVEDDGPGVSQDLRPRVFDPYFTTEADPSHTGLGLFLARGIARRFGGELFLDEDYASGARFVLRLPTAVPSVRGASSFSGVPANDEPPLCVAPCGAWSTFGATAAGGDLWNRQWIAANDHDEVWQQGGSDGAA